jgi:hypothetical protein
MEQEHNYVPSQQALNPALLVTDSFEQWKDVSAGLLIFVIFESVQSKYAYILRCWYPWLWCVCYSNHKNSV